MSERDFPIGHPSASDYKGEKYIPPRAPWAADYDFDHPAYGGKNCSDLDTPDGMRAAVLTRTQDLDELAAIGALPGVEQAPQNKALTVDAKTQEALDYLKDRGYDSDHAKGIVRDFGFERVLEDKAKHTQK